MQIYMYEIILPGQESNHLYCGIERVFMVLGIVKAHPGIMLGDFFSHALQ